MTHNAAASPPSRPPSSASSTASSSLGSAGQLARVHDHSRPLPPPRTPPPATSFRSAARPSPGAAVPVAVVAAAVDQPGPEVSLQAPRPDGERIANEYVETPFRPTPTCQRHETTTTTATSTTVTTAATTTTTTATTATTTQPAAKAQPPGRERRPHHGPKPQHRPRPEPTAGATGRARRGQPATAAVTKQPVSFTKEPATRLEGPGPGQAASLSIMCERCGRCRCESCREPPPLPSRWLCDNACFCSAESALDYASCLCCVKGLFYHCADGGGSLGAAGPSSALESDELGGGGCADEPCSCGGPRVAARWGCLSALALALPCLLCYWPLRACVALCEACYAKHATQGCRCEPRAGAPAGAASQALASAQLSEALMRDSRDPEKRLLDPLGPEL